LANALTKLKQIGTERVFIVGLGAQGKAWAQNWRDSGLAPTILLRPESINAKNKSCQECQQLALPVISLSEFIPIPGDVIALLTPDDSHANILGNFAKFTHVPLIFIYAHGFSVLKDQPQKQYPAWSHLLLAPKAIAQEVRTAFQNKTSLAAVASLEFTLMDHGPELLAELAQNLGINQGPFMASFKEETYADLFSEQSLLCGLLPYAAKKSFEMMRQRGVCSEVAYLECWREVKLIADAMLKIGPKGFHEMISPNALIGGDKAQHLLFDKPFQQKLEQLAEDVWSGKFLEEIEELNTPNRRQKIAEYWGQSELEKVWRQLEQATNKK